jgi:hypothetical protein
VPQVRGAVVEVGDFNCGKLERRGHCGS